MNKIPLPVHPLQNHKLFICSPYYLGNPPMVFENDGLSILSFGKQIK